MTDLEAELRILRLQLLSVEGQCIEEHHWKGNCPASGWQAEAIRARDAGNTAHKRQDEVILGQKARINALETDLDDTQKYLQAKVEYIGAADDEIRELRAQLDGAVQAAHAERDMHWKVKVENLRAHLSTVRAETLEEAAKVVEATEVVVFDYEEDFGNIVEMEDGTATLANAATAIRALNAPAAPTAKGEE